MANRAAKRKIEKYKAIIEQNYLFIPFAVETLGPWNDEAKIFVDDLGNKIRQTSGQPKSKLFLKQRISIAVQRGNAACVMGTFPSSMSMDEIYYIL